MGDIVCPHCGFPIPTSGKGSKMVLKLPGRSTAKLPKDAVPKPSKPKPADLLGDLVDAYWNLAKVFGPNKNFEVLESCAAYVRLVREHGWSPERVQARAEIYVRLTEDPKFLKQMVVWLNSQVYLPPETEPLTPGGFNGDTASRLHARHRAG